MEAKGEGWLLCLHGPEKAQSESCFKKNIF